MAFMTPRRWMGLAMLVLAIALGIALQLRDGTLYQVQFDISTPARVVSENEDTTVLQFHEIQSTITFRKWPYTALLVVMGGVGLALLVWRRSNPKTPEPGSG